DRNCIYLTRGKCGNCAKVCPTDAVDYEDKAETVEIKVGSIVLASGFEPYDPGRYDTFGYTRHKNVITSLEFERLLAASGPTLGHVVRPSDKKEPGRVAFLQCVGSRDVHQGAKGYCSSICCTSAVKEAGLAMDHVKGLEASIFYMDMRTTGKDFERYYNRAQENGVRFIKTRVSSLGPGEEEGDLEIRYTSPEGLLKKETFNLVVLSVGLTPGAGIGEQAERLDLELDQEGFPKGDFFKPVRTGREGIYVCGAVQEPKDIPQSVIDASAAAGEAAAFLAPARGSLARSKEPVEETDVIGEPPRIGVFVCHCGTNIAGVVDVEAVEEYAKGLPYVAHTERNLFSCSQDSQEKIAQVIKEHQLNRLVVAACTPRTHEPLFQETATQAGLNKYLFEMANIRNQCSWVHSQEPEKATEKSKELVAMAVAKAAGLRPLQEQELAINDQALVIGGGAAGMEAAANLADQ
ncbi:MAG: FAD-dependent oxidoreductase, partial [Chlorobiales bacterium]|nr:FAD-dependent oxidoreductase [Chlorobiales bacterium]